MMSFKRREEQIGKTGCRSGPLKRRFWSSFMFSFSTVVCGVGAGETRRGDFHTHPKFLSHF